MITETNLNLQQANSILKASKSLELLSQFRNTETWFSESEKAVGMIKLLGRHGIAYFSPLRAAFLFQFKSADSLAYFSPSIARDGALTLLHYFLHHQCPADPRQLILINHELKNLIPIDWAKNVLTYKVCSFRKLKKKKTRLILIATALGPKQFAIDSLTNLRSKLSADVVELIWISVVPENQNDSNTQENLLNHQAQLLLAACKWNLPLKIESIQSLQGQDLTDSYFMDLNDSFFYYSDSFLVHLLMQLGSMPYNEKQNRIDVDAARIPLSFYHELQIFDSQQGNPKIDEELNDFRNSQLLMAEESRHRPEKISFDQKICSSAFESFAYKLLKSR